MTVGAALDADAEMLAAVLPAAEAAIVASVNGDHEIEEEEGE